MSRKEPSSSSDLRSETSGSDVLNAVFNFNGHSFDAYEVLGIPAGSSWEEVKRAFERSLESNDPSAKEFYLTAFNAIKAKHKF